MAECEKVCRYVDLPLQHASADVLKRMRRPGQPQDLRRAARADPRRAFPASHCGRPSSSASPARPKQDFAELERFVRDTGFDHIGVFTYSHEEGTRAYARDGRRAGGDSSGRGATDLMAAAADRRRAPEGADRRRGGPADRRPVGRARAGPARAASKARRPISTPWSISPTAIRRPSAGDLIRATIVGARGYDLMATPVS